jgi:hypothetical protein
MTEMTLEQAQEIAREVTEGVIRWGAKNYGTGIYTPIQLAEAITALSTAAVQPDIVEALRQENKVLKKDLSLCKAREGKARKELKELKDKG